MSPEPNQIEPQHGHQTACGLLRLLLVMLYDAIVVLAILMIAGAIALELPFSNQTAGKDPAYTLYLLSVWFLYLAWCWRNGGMTLGMRAWKVRLLNDSADDHNQPPHWWQCGLRFLGAWLSLLPLGVGYGWMLIDREQRSWHDLLSHTRLVHTTANATSQVSDATPEEVNRRNAE
jgi:uncharacterized RDD family membrane protein YckC